MVTAFPLDSSNWVLPSHQPTLSSTLPDYEGSLPVRVNREGITNYIKNRGSLNLGDWATEGRRMSISSGTEPRTPVPNPLEPPPPKVLGPDAMRNYIKSRSSTPNLLYGNLTGPNPHNHFRVKKEGRANYDKNQHSQMKVLLENYGKLPLPSPKRPHTQGEMATNLFYTHQEGTLGPILNDYGHLPLSARPAPHVKGDAAEINLQKGLGNSKILEHTRSYREPTPDPHVKGAQAQLNYDNAQGRGMDKLLHEYGKLPQSARTIPKVKYDGVQNFEKAKGDAMRKALSQCPPSNRLHEHLQPIPSWP